MRGTATLVVEPFEPLANEARTVLTEEGERLVPLLEDGAAEGFDVRFEEE